MDLSRKLKIVSGVIFGVGFLLGIYMGDVFSKSKINSGLPGGTIVIRYEQSCNILFCTNLPITKNMKSTLKSKKVPNTNAILITWGIAGTLTATVFYSAKYIENKK